MPAKAGVMVSHTSGSAWELSRRSRVVLPVDHAEPCAPPAPRPCGRCTPSLAPNGPGLPAIRAVRASRAPSQGSAVTRPGTPSRVECERSASDDLVSARYMVEAVDEAVDHHRTQVGVELGQTSSP